MVFSDTSTNQGLIQDIDFRIGTNSATYDIKDKTRNINSALQNVAYLIQTADGKWDWEDTNNTDMPVATTSIVAGQQDYSIDTTFLKIKEVFYTDQNGDTTKLDFSGDKNYFLSLSTSDTGIPSKYTILGNSILLDCYPTTGTSTKPLIKLTVYFVRDITLFNTTDTTATAGFNPQFHKYLSLSASYDYAIAKDKKIATSLRNEMIIMENAIKSFYSSRLQVENKNIRIQGINQINYL